MTTIITRSFLVGMGRKVPNNLASVVDGKVVTWDDVMRHRRQKQLDIIARRDRSIEHSRPRAYRIWVAYFDQFLFGGWQAFIENFRGDVGRTWIDRDQPTIKADLMNAFPLVLKFQSDNDINFHRAESWERWKKAFATHFKRRMQCRKPVGVAYAWWDGRGDIHPVK